MYWQALWTTVSIPIMKRARKNSLFVEMLCLELEVR